MRWEIGAHSGGTWVPAAAPCDLRELGGSSSHLCPQHTRLWGLSHQHISVLVSTSSQGNTYVSAAHSELHPSRLSPIQWLCFCSCEHALSSSSGLAASCTSALPAPSSSLQLQHRPRFRLRPWVFSLHTPQGAQAHPSILPSTGTTPKSQAWLAMEALAPCFPLPTTLSPIQVQPSPLSVMLSHTCCFPGTYYLSVLSAALLSTDHIPSFNPHNPIKLV